MNKNKKILGLLLGLSMGLAPIAYNVLNEEINVLADTVNADTITLGAYDRDSGTFKDATASVYNSYKSISISLANEIMGNEEIVLPEVEGYNENEDISTRYSKVININKETNAKEIVESYIRKVGFKNCTNQKVSIVLNKNETENKVAYFANNDHYYMYINDSTKDWTEAYEIAKNSEYLGRQGYLATITSIEEDMFICEVTENSIGWLGGTMLKPGSKNGNYYDSFETTEPYDTHWYWANGPEIGNEFFDVIAVSKDNADAQNETYTRNYDTLGYYFNWNNHPYNGRLDEMEPNQNVTETCLTTLNQGSGYATNGKIYNYSYSWNNIEYSNHGTSSFQAHGYVIEFGDLVNGDSNSTQSTNYVSTVSSFHDHTEHGYAEWTSTNSLPTTAGNYYLASDVTLTSTWTVPSGEVNLCLNGKVLSGDGTFNLIKVNNGTSLNLCNCDRETVHYGYCDKDGVFHYDPTDSHELLEDEGKIDYNSALIINGLGAITVDGGNLTLDGIVIAGNTAENGAGINIINGNCSIYSGTVEFNKATQNGGGIYNNGNLYIYDTDVGYNNAILGAGIYQNGELTVGSNSCIAYNHDTNVYLPEGKLINVATGMYEPDDPYIGITLEKELDVFATDCLENYSAMGYFFSDNEDYGCIGKETGSGYELSLATLFKITTDKPYDDYETNNGAIIATYEDIHTALPGEVLSAIIYSNEGYMLVPNSFKINDGEIEAILVDCGEYDWYCYYEFIFVMPEKDINLTCEFQTYVERTYNEITVFEFDSCNYGEELSYTLEATYGQDIAEFCYCEYDDDSGLFTKGLPTEAGHYWILAHIPGNDTYGDTFGYAECEILKVENEILTLSIEDWTYGEDAKTPTATAKYGDIKFVYSTSEDGEYSEVVPTTAGTYYVKAIVEETSSYEGASKVETFTISKATDNEISDLAIEGWAEGETPNTPTASSKYGTVKFTYSDSENGTYSEVVPTAKGAYYVKASVEETENYNGASKVMSFFIEKITEDPFEPDPIDPADPTDPEDPGECFLHYVLIGLFVIAIIAVVLYLLNIIDKVVEYIILGVTLLGTLVLGLIGIIGNECNVCLILLIIFGALIACALVATFLNLKEKLQGSKESKMKVDLEKGSIEEMVYNLISKDPHITVAQLVINTSSNEAEVNKAIDSLIRKNLVKIGTTSNYEIVK